MTDYIGGEPPTSSLISLTRGADKVLTLRRKDSEGDPADWDAEVYMIIDTPEPTQVDADVTDDIAVLRIESDDCDDLKSESWRVIMSQAGSPTLETALLRGKFKRND